LKTRSTFINESMLGLISLVEPTSIDEALKDDVKFKHVSFKIFYARFQHQRHKYEC